jgi:hypothetical protein
MKTQTGIKLSHLLHPLGARPLTDKAELDVDGCYISDLLSDVLAHARPGMLWVTIQTHRNVVSVAATKDIGAVLITCGRRPDPAIIAEADENGIAILTTPLTTYAVAARLWEAGLRE